MILRQDEPAQLRPEVAIDPGGKRCHHRAAVGRHPALAPVANGDRPQNQILDEETLVALEARARRHFRRHHPILDHNAAHLLATAATALACAGRRPRLARLLHAGGLDRRPALQALQPRDLLAQRRILCRQTRHLTERLDQQASQLVSTNPIKICWQPCHGHHRIVMLSSWEVPAITPIRFVAPAPKPRSPDRGPRRQLPLPGLMPLLQIAKGMPWQIDLSNPRSLN